MNEEKLEDKLIEKTVDRAVAPFGREEDFSSGIGGRLTLE
jgi:hypothetical protein